MKVLITGGYGFLGRNVAEKFHKEGYEIIVLDDLSAGHKTPLPFKHSFHERNAGDIACAQIFRKQKIDVVVHLAWKKVGETESASFNENLAAVNNILHLCHNHGVKKLIFTSSTNVYGRHLDKVGEEVRPNPVSNEALCQLMCENACLQWSMARNVEATILRVSEVYGPLQNLNPDSRVYKAMTNGDLEEHIDELVSLLYMSDYTDAVFQATAPLCNGVYNIAPAVSYRSSYVKRAIRFASGSLSQGGDATLGEVDGLYVIIKATAFGWQPRVTLQDGLMITHNWFEKAGRALAREQQKHIAQAHKRSLGKNQPLAYIENFALFLVTFLLSYLQAIGTIDLIIDIRIIYIIIVGIFWGIRQSIIAGVLACFIFIFNQVAIGSAYASLVYDINQVLVMAQYLIIGASIGTVVDRRDYEIMIKNEEIVKCSEEYTYLYKQYDETMVIKEELELRLLEYGDSYGKVFAIVSSLDALEADKVLYASFDALSQILKMDDISIYNVHHDSQYMRRVGTHGTARHIFPNSLKITENPVVRSVVESRQIYTNVKSVPDMPAMIGPVIHGGKVICIVVIERVNFERMNLYSVNLFKVALNLMAEALGRAYEHEEAIYDRKYIPGTSIMNAAAFMNHLERRRNAREQGINDYSLIRIDCDNNVLETALRIERLIRDCDIIGECSRDSIYVILENADRANATIVLNRMRAADIAAYFIDV